MSARPFLTADAARRRDELALRDARAGAVMVAVVLAAWSAAVVRFAGWL